MWEQFGKEKAYLYGGYKFQPTHRVGLTNYVREEAIDRLLRTVPHEAVIDVGCATGRQLLRARDTIHKGLGVDIAESFITEANKQKALCEAEHITFTASVGERIPADDASFDVAISSEVIEHVHDKDAMLKELRRLIKPGGYLLLTTPNYNADGTWWGRLMRTLGYRSFHSLEHFTIEELARHGDAHVREFSRTSLRASLEQHGFDVKKVRYCSYVDGPYFDTLLKYPLHLAPLRWLIISFEQALGRTALPLGRHLVFLAKRVE